MNQDERRSCGASAFFVGRGSGPVIHRAAKEGAGGHLAALQAAGWGIGSFPRAAFVAHLPWAVLFRPFRPGASGEGAVRSSGFGWRERWRAGRGVDPPDGAERPSPTGQGSYTRETEENLTTDFTDYSDF